MHGCYFLYKREDGRQGDGRPHLPILLVLPDILVIDGEKVLNRACMGASQREVARTFSKIAPRALFSARMRERRVRSSAVRARNFANVSHGSSFVKAKGNFGNFSCSTREPSG